MARFGGEAHFAGVYRRPYLHGDRQLPVYVDKPAAYHRNPLEAEEYSFEARFRSAEGRVVLDEPSTS